jgi:hypothetical protein
VQICYELGSLDIMNMVATLGSGECGGSVYIMDFLKLLTHQRGHGISTQEIDVILYQHLIEQCGQLIVTLIAHEQLLVC